MFAGAILQIHKHLATTDRKETVVSIVAYFVRFLPISVAIYENESLGLK